MVKYYLLLYLQSLKSKLLNIIIGTHECKADAKGRLLLPSPFKKQLPDLQDGFVLKRAIYTQSLELWPMAEWNIMMKDLSQMNRFDPETNKFLTHFVSGIKMIDIDDIGRILIPKDLIAFAKIDKEVVFSAKINIIEIWDKTIYEKEVGSNTDDFAKLTERVMKNFKSTNNGLS